MAWPTGTISTANLDSDSDSPAAARSDLKQAVDAVNNIIGAKDAASGIPSLDANSKVPAVQGGVPAGAMFPFAGTAAPTGYLLCDGSAVSRSTYAALFTAIGTVWGAGDGTTTFNLPDMRGRVAAGRDDMGGTNAQRLTVVLTGNTTSGNASVTALSSTANLAVGMRVFGAGIPAGATIATITSSTAITLSANATATATGVSLRFGIVDGITLGDAAGDDVHTLATTQIPAHSHNYDSGGNSHYVLRSSGGTLGLTTGSVQANLATATQNAGGGQAHPNVQPTAVVNYIIKT